MSGVARAAILSAAHNPLIARLVSRYGMRLGAARFVSGETLDECVAVLRRLNEAGLKANTGLLGENVADAQAALAVAAEYETILRRLAAERLNANVSLKLTHLGLGLGEDVAYGNLTRLLELAASLRTSVRVDMEESRHVDATLRLYERARESGFDNVGVVLQAYLYRTPADLERLLPLRPNVRLVKGAYLEPPDVAFPRKADVDRSYVTLAERLLSDGGYTAVATHDDRIIEHVIGFTGRHGVARDRFEFQMLYGVRPQRQRDLAASGHTVLVAAPFGPDWYPYLMRRLAERPANVLFLARNLLRR